MADVTTRADPYSTAVDQAELDRLSAAETDAGLGIPLAEVEAWVESWDTEAELPMPVARPVR